MFWVFWKGEVVQVTYWIGDVVYAGTEEQTAELAELFPDVIYFKDGEN